MDTGRKASVHLSDIAIIRMILAGETEAFRELVGRHQQMLLGVLAPMLGDPLAAQETAHETFVKAYTGLAGFRAESRFSTWLLQIGMNLARDRMRRKQLLARKGIISLDALRQQQQDRWEPAGTGPGTDPLGELAGRQEWDLLQEVLATLGDDLREAFVLRHIEGLDYGEIALITGASPGSLKVRAHRARRQLRTKLAARGLFPDTGNTTGTAGESRTRKDG